MSVNTSTQIGDISTKGSVSRERWSEETVTLRWEMEESSSFSKSMVGRRTSDQLEEIRELKPNNLALQRLPQQNGEIARSSHAEPQECSDSLVTCREL